MTTLAAGGPTMLYRIYDAVGGLLYVGISDDTSQHGYVTTPGFSLGGLWSTP